MNLPSHVLHSDLVLLPLPCVIAVILLFAEGFVFFSKSVSWKKSGGFLLFVSEVGGRGDGVGEVKRGDVIWKGR